MLKAKELLEIIRTNSEKTCNLEILGVVLNELGIVSFEIGLYSEGVMCFLESIKTKAKLGLKTGIKLTIQNLTASLYRHPEALIDLRVRHLLENEIKI